LILDTILDVLSLSIDTGYQFVFFLFLSGNYMALSARDRIKLNYKIYCHLQYMYDDSKVMKSSN